MSQQPNSFPLIFFATCGIILLLIIVFAETPRSILWQKKPLVREADLVQYTFINTPTPTDTGYVKIQFTKLPISIELSSSVNAYYENYFFAGSNKDNFKFSGSKIVADLQGIPPIVFAAYADNFRNNIEAGQFEFNDYIKNQDETLTLISPDNYRFTLKKEYFSFLKTRDGHEVLKVYGAKDLEDWSVNTPVSEGTIAAMIKVQFGEFKSVSLFSHLDEADFDRAIQSIEVRE